MCSIEGRWPSRLLRHSPRSDYCWWQKRSCCVCLWSPWCRNLTSCPLSELKPGAQPKGRKTFVKCGHSLSKWQWKSLCLSRKHFVFLKRSFFFNGFVWCKVIWQLLGSKLKPGGEPEGKTSLWSAVNLEGFFKVAVEIPLSFTKDVV